MYNLYKRLLLVNFLLPVAYMQKIVSFCRILCLMMTVTTAWVSIVAQYLAIVNLNKKVSLKIIKLIKKLLGKGSDIENSLSFKLL
jgi:hypothetical protein